MSFPTVSAADRAKLVGNLQSWSFDALSLTPDELLTCMSLIFESLASMEGVDFDLGTPRPEVKSCLVILIPSCTQIGSDAFSCLFGLPTTSATVTTTSSTPPT